MGHLASHAGAAQHQQYACVHGACPPGCPGTLAPQQRSRLAWTLQCPAAWLSKHTHQLHLNLPQAVMPVAFSQLAAPSSPVPDSCQANKQASPGHAMLAFCAMTPWPRAGAAGLLHGPRRSSAATAGPEAALNPAALDRKAYSPLHRWWAPWASRARCWSGRATPAPSWWT